MNKLEDLYALLGVDSEASGEQLRKAFRKESLKCHPDKVRGQLMIDFCLSAQQNPDDKDAVDRFYALKDAFDLLSAPDKRAAYDAKRESALKQQERFASLNGKRQADLADLQAREEAFKRQKTEQRDERNELERIKEANAKMMRDRQAATAAASPRPVSEEAPSRPQSNGKLGEHDTKVSLKWPANIQNAALADSPALEAALAKLCGPVASCAVLPKRKAVVEFARLSSAVKAVDYSRREGTVLEGVTVTWLMGEPSAVQAARARGTAPLSNAPSPTSNGVSVTAAKPPSLSEDAVLAMMREQQRRKAEERARLEAEILAQDEEDERLMAGR